MSIKRRIERLERRPDLLPVKPSPHVVEMQELTRRIAHRDAEIAEIESKMTLKELERSREEKREFQESVRAFRSTHTIDETIAWLDTQILELEETIEEEGGIAIV